MDRPIFILGPGRSFTTVIAAMLGQHPDLYGFPELNLPVADTVGGWLDYTDAPAKRWLRNGLLRALAEIETGAQTDETVLAAQDWLMSRPAMRMDALLADLRAAVAPRRMVEKSPHAVSEARFLGRLGRMAPDALYVHVTRHPFSSCRSMAQTDWFSLALRIGTVEAYDFRGAPPVFDPQFHWLGSHRRILAFLESVPPERQLRIRGEDVLSAPAEALRDLCRWIGVADDPSSVEEMLHPERSPFAAPGPASAPYGTDPAFLESPALRAFTPPEAPLSGSLPWRGDRAEFVPEVRELARVFDYRDGRPPQPALPAGFDGRHGALVAIEPDGSGVPMAHANLLDNSYSTLPPLTEMRAVDYRPQPAVTWINFGSYSGAEITVSVFDSCDEPALVAMRNADGARIWETPLDILPCLRGSRLRWVSGLLLARLRFADGTAVPCIFAGNASEIVCLSQDGRLVWRNATGEAGAPRCIRFTADNHLVFATTPTRPRDIAQVVKIDPLTGRIVDRRRLTCALEIDGRTVSGGFQVFQSIVVDGDHAFVEGMFQAEMPLPAAADALLPACLMRLRVSGTPDGRIAPSEAEPIDPLVRIGVVGNRRQGGSPSAIRGRDGRLVVVTNGFSAPPRTRGLRPSYRISAFRDTPRAIEPLWHFEVTGHEDPSIAAAPAIDPVTETYVAATRFELYLIGAISERRGAIRPDLAVPALDLLAGRFRTEATAAEVSSPIVLCRNGDESAFYAYLGLAAWTWDVPDNYALLTALRIDVTPYRVTPVWTASMAVDERGTPRPAPRSFAQPALFPLRGGDRPEVGIAMSTMTSGVAIYR